jgi:hypothetical protein
MGFCWSANVLIEFAQGVAVPRYGPRFVKRLIEWHPPVDFDAVLTQPAGKKQKKRRTAARPLAADDTPPAASGRAARPPAADDTSSDEEFDDEECAWSDTEGEMDSDQLALLKELKDACGGEAVYFDDCIYTNYQELVEKAFKRAATALLGSGHGVCLTIDDHLGSDGNVGDGAKSDFAYLSYEPVSTNAGDGADMPRGGMNIPWGGKLTALPSMSVEEDAATRSKFARVISAFGLSPGGDASLKLVTTSSCG